MSLDEQVRDLLSVAGADVEPTVLDPTTRVLRRAARQRRHTVGLSVLTVAAVSAVTASLALTFTRHQASPVSNVSAAPTVRSLLARPLHLERLAPGQPCSATPGAPIHTALFNGVALGQGPVRVLLGDRGDLRHGQVSLPATRTRLGRHTIAIQTLWFAVPDYNGPFVVRGKSLSGPAKIEVQPGGDGLEPGTGPLVVPAGPTPNTGSDGYRSAPGSTWLSAPGCYAWQIDGDGFSDTITFHATQN